jgi:hypothetical protein
MNNDNCPKCGVPYAIVGRVHNCAAVVSNLVAGNSAGDQAAGAYQPAMCETPPASGEQSPVITANRGEPGLIKRRRKPDTRKRKRAAYMRGYRANRKQAQQEATQ